MAGRIDEKCVSTDRSTDHFERLSMENFSFFNPTRIEFGTGKEQLIAITSTLAVPGAVPAWAEPGVQQNIVVTRSTAQPSLKGSEEWLTGAVASCSI